LAEIYSLVGEINGRHGKSDTATILGSIYLQVHVQALSITRQSGFFTNLSTNAN